MLYALIAGQIPTLGRAKELAGRKVGARGRLGGKFFCAVLLGLAFLAFTMLFASTPPAHADALQDKPPFHQLATYKNMLVMDQIETNWLYDLSMDFIKNGLADYYKTGERRTYARNKFRSKGYSLLICNVDYQDKDRFTGELLYNYTRIVASARHIENELWCVYQQEYKGIIYEYWLLKLRVKNRRYPFRYCEFILTQTPSKQEARQIFHSSQQFFKTYTIDNDFSIVFPEKAFNEVFYSINYISCPNCCNNLGK